MSKEKGAANIIIYVIIGLVVLVGLKVGYKKYNEYRLKKLFYHAFSNKSEDKPEKKVTDVPSSKEINEFIKENFPEDTIPELNWKAKSKEKTKMLFVEFKDNENSITFIEEASDHRISHRCDQDEEFFLYTYIGQRVGGDSLNYLVTREDLCIPKTCETNLEKIDNSCVCDYAKKELRLNINDSIDAFLKSGHASGKEAEDATLAKNKFINFKASCYTKEIYNVTYEDEMGGLDVVLDLEDNIISVIEFSPILY